MIQSIRQRHQLDMKAEVQDEEVKGTRLFDDYDLEKRSKISGKDVKEADAGIELLRKMKAVKREDALEISQKAADIEGQRLKARSAATDEAQISMADGKQADQLAEISRMKQAKALSEEQMMALSAKDSAAVAAALKEKYGSDQVKAMYEQRMKDQETYVQRMQQMEERSMDRMERVHHKSLEEMGLTASTRAEPGAVPGTTVVTTGGGLYGGAPVVVGSGSLQNPLSRGQPPGKVILCRKCNAELDPTEKFCNSCGEKVQP